MPSSPLARALLVFGLGLSVLLLGTAAWLYSQQPSGLTVEVGTVSGSGAADIGGPFTLVDQHGQARSDQDFRGKFMLVYFGYTFCPDFCPSSLSVMTQALDRLAKQDPEVAASVVPVLISIDPERDTVEALAAYAPHFHERLVALTGTPEAVADAAAGYRVYYAKAESDAASDYLMDHSTFIYLMDPEGRYATHFSHYATPEEIAQAIETAAQK